MSYRKSFTLLAALAALSLPGSLSAAPPSAAECLAPYRLASVGPYRVQLPAGYSVEERLAGAQLFVYAEPGLTGEWLEYSLEQRRMGTTTSECPYDVPGSTIHVQSGGPGFWVLVGAKDPDAAKEILKRSKRLPTLETLSQAP